MNPMVYWARWMIVLPFAGAVYFVVQVGIILIGVPYLHDLIIDDYPGGVEVSSHLLWDWIARPLAFVSVGAMSATGAMKAATLAAPSHKTPTACVIAGMIILLVLANILLVFAGHAQEPLSSSVSVVPANVSAGVCAILLVREQVVQIGTA